MQPLLQLTGIDKAFPGVKALSGAALAVYPGRVMALVGENGAGKSTMMKVLTGIYSKDAGTPAFRGNEVTFGGIDWPRMYREADRLLARLNLQYGSRRLVGDLSIGDQQMVEIAKVISFKSEVIIMDEPTDALTDTETASLFSVIRELKQQGCGIVYISHRLKEIFEICDDVTVMRDGQFIAERQVCDLQEDSLIEMMVGRRLEEQYPRVTLTPGAECLVVDHLS